MPTRTSHPAPNARPPAVPGSTGLLVLSALLCAGSPSLALAQSPAPAADPAPTAAPAAPPAAAQSPAGGSDVREVEQRVSGLKDQLFRAKARLSLLSETFLRSSSGGNRAIVEYQDQIGPLLLPVQLTMQLDGREIVSRTAATSAKGQPVRLASEPRAWDGELKPGEHTLSVTIVYRGSSARVLPYFEQYSYTATAAHRFKAADGGTTRVRVRCRESGNPITTDLKDRPRIEFEVDSGAAPSSPAAAAAATQGGAKAR